MSQEPLQPNAQPPQQTIQPQTVVVSGDSQNKAPSGGNNFLSLAATAVVAACMGFCSTVMYYKYFPPTPPKEPLPIAIVDMVQLGSALARMSSDGDDQAFIAMGHAIAMLKESGFIVIDGRTVLAAPDEYLKKPSELVPGAPDNALGLGFGGYKSPLEKLDDQDRGENEGQKQ